MIGKLFPRLLNKSADRSAIKPNEFTDALNILVTSDDGGDGNIIKKGNGTIRSVVADPDYFPFPDIGISENVVGHLVDQEKLRVYYFAHGEGPNGKTSAIYLLKQTGENEISLMCLLRDDDLDFSNEDFVEADLIRVPVRKIDTGTDPTVSGSTGDDTSPFEDDGLTDEEGNTSAFTVVTPPLYTTPYQIPTADYNATGFQYEGGFITVGNFGTANATATISIEVLANGTGVTVTPIFSNQGTPTATITVPGSTFGLEIPFSFTVSNAANAGGNFSIPFKITVAEQQTGNLTGSPFFQEYVELVEFVVPQILYPESFIVRYQGTNFLQPTNTPGLFAEDWGSVDLGEIPENEFNAIIGPFQVELTGDEPNEFQYRPDLTFSAYTDVVTSQSPVIGAWSIGGIADSIADVFVPTPTTALSAYITALNTTIAGDIPLADQTFSFWIVKATDTIDWIDDYGPDFVIPFNILLQDGGEFTLTSGQSSFHSGEFVAQVADVPTPPQIIVENPFGAMSAEAVFAPHVDDNTFQYSGQDQQFGFTVTNVGETDGYFRINTDWSRIAYNTLFAGYTGQDLQTYIQEFEEDNQGRWRGMWEMTEFELLDPSSGALISGPHKLFSDRYTNLEFGAGQSPLGLLMNGIPALQGWFTNQPANIFEISGESSVLVRFYASNASSLFATAGFSGGSAEIGGDSTISDVYVGTSGPYSFWGEPNSSTGAQNSDVLDVFVETSVDNSGLPETFTSTVFVSNVVYDVDPDYVGPLRIWAPKTPLADGHPLVADPVLGGATGSAFLEAFLPDGSILGDYGETDGEKFFLAGLYSDNIYANPTRSSVGLLTPDQWQDRFEYWSQRTSTGQGSVDIAFYNSSTDGAPATVKLIGDTNIPWFNANGVQLDNSGNYDVNALNDLLSVAGWNMPGTEINHSVFTAGQGIGNPNTDRTGTLGTAWLITTPFYIAPNTEAGNLPDYEGLFTDVSQWNADAAEGAYNWPGPGIMFAQNFDHYHGGWRTAEFDVPPKRCVVVRLAFSLQSHGAGPTPGIEDVLQNTDFPDPITGLPDYSDPRTNWGYPVKINAEWTGGITNPEPNTVSFGLAVMTPDISQFNNIT